MEKITIVEFHNRCKAQGASSIGHVAFKCPVCGTVQSMVSLTRAGASDEQAESWAGFSCEGRLNGAGPWRPNDPGRAKVRGCDWSLGGLFKLHKLTVVTNDGKEHPHFELASSEEAKALEEGLTTMRA